MVLLSRKSDQNGIWGGLGGFKEERREVEGRKGRRKRRKRKKRRQELERKEGGRWQGLLQHRLLCSVTMLCYILPLKAWPADRKCSVKN